MTLTISPPLIQQLQPRFLQARGLFEAREGRAKIYHWSAFVVSIIASEIPYRLVAGCIYWAAWYFPPHFPWTGLPPGMMLVWVLMFEMFYLSFGQGIASFAPNELLASLLVPGNKNRIFLGKFKLTKKSFFPLRRLLLRCCCAVCVLAVLLAKLGKSKYPRRKSQHT